MKTRSVLPLLTSALAFAAPDAAAQSSLPRLFVPAVSGYSPGLRSVVSCDVTGRPNSPYLVLVDVDGGPVDLLGVRFQLGLTPALGTLCAGRLPAFGQERALVSISQVAGMFGVPFHLQAVVLNPAAANGVFDVSNGESTTILLSPLRIEERFDDARADGFVGGFDPLVRDRLQGGPVRRRVHSTIDPQGFSFSAPIQTPLNHYGARAQLCFRARDVGATGDQEMLTAIRWRLFGSTVVADRFDQLEILASHSDVVPDYTVDPFTALPRFPNSGLDPFYANNVKAGETPQLLRSGTYAIGAGDLRADGYVDYALAQEFRYNGQDSLLLDLRMSPSLVAGSGANGQIVRLMVQSSPQPNARVTSVGRAGVLIDPNAVAVGRGDNALYDYQLEFVRVETTATSPWRAAGPGSGRDYQAPVVATVEPAGTSLAIEYRGADDAGGSGATAWSVNIDGADGKAFVQFRVTFRGNAQTGEVPAIDSLVIPVL